MNPKKLNRCLKEESRIIRKQYYYQQYNQYEREAVMAGSALVRPGDITDAVDSNDLLGRILTENLSVIGDKVDARNRKAWAIKEGKRIRETYYNRAAGAYEKIWDACGDHVPTLIDCGGYNVYQCRDCKFSYPQAHETMYAAPRKRKTEEMNRYLINVMVDRMVELDIEAGILTWPTEDDYPTPYSSKDPTPYSSKVFAKPISGLFRRK